MPSLDQAVDDERLKRGQDLESVSAIDLVEHHAECLDDASIDDARLGDVRRRPSTLAHGRRLPGEPLFPCEPGRRVEKKRFTFRSDRPLRHDETFPHSMLTDTQATEAST